jgi:hypothetical protein
MTRRLAVTVTTLVVAALAVAPAHAGPAKVLKGSYQVTLSPDPTAEAAGQLPGAQGCSGVSPSGKDSHAFVVPGAGTLSVVLDAPDPAGSSATDWDLFLLEPDGTENTSSTGASAHEEAVAKFKAGQKLTIQVCNLAGAPNGTVTYTFTPKKK